MAQERIQWKLIGTVLNIVQDGNFLAAFELSEIYKDFTTMTEVQQMVIVYGIKQNLSDKIAGMKDYTLKEKVKVMGERFQSLKNGIWKSPSKEKASVKKRAEELAKNNALTIQDVELLKKLGLYTEELAKIFKESK